MLLNGHIELCSCHDVEVNNNTFSNLCYYFSMYTTPGIIQERFHIHHNLFVGLGYSGNTSTGMGFYQAGTTPYTMRDIYVDNNTFVCNRSTNTLYLIVIPSSCVFRNISLRNNIFTGYYKAITSGSSTVGSIDSVYLRNNNYYDNNTDVIWGGITPSHLTISGTVSTNPLFVSPTDYTLQSLSPNRNAGLDIGYSYLESAPDIGAYEYVFEIPEVLSTVIIDTPYNITSRTLNIYASVVLDGGGTVSERGIVWNTSTTPTISNFKLVNGSGLGVFYSLINPLTPSTTYYFRAYAINEAGIAYSTQLVLTTKYSSTLYYKGKRVKYLGKVIKF